MWDLVTKKRVIAGVSVFAVILAAGIALSVYQPASKTDEIYTQALTDYEKGDYQNSYYLFSKVTLFSNLKPYAIYHQAE